MASVYELTNALNTLWSLLDEEVVDDEVLLDAFENTKEDLTIKLENCCKYIKNTESEIAGLKEEEKRLHARRVAKENAVERLKALMQKALEVAGEKKLVCGTFTTSIQANPPRVVMDCESIDGIPEMYLTFPEPEINKKKIKESLEKGFEMEWAHLEQSSSLRIR